MKPNTTRVLTIIFSRNLGQNFRTSLHDINNWLLLKEERIRKECYGYLESYKPTTTVDHIIISSLWFAIDYHPFVTCVESCRIWIMAKSNFPQSRNIEKPSHGWSMYHTWCAKKFKWVVRYDFYLYRPSRTVLVPSWCIMHVGERPDLAVSNLTTLEIVVLGRPPLTRPLETCFTCLKSVVSIEQFLKIPTPRLSGN